MLNILFLLWVSFNVYSCLLYFVLKSCYFLLILDSWFLVVFNTKCCFVQVRCSFLGLALLSMSFHFDIFSRCLVLVDICLIQSLCHFIWEFLYLNFKHLENGIYWFPLIFPSILLWWKCCQTISGILCQGFHKWGHLVVFQSLFPFKA